PDAAGEPRAGRQRDGAASLLPPAVPAGVLARGARHEPGSGRGGGGPVADPTRRRRRRPRAAARRRRASRRRQITPAMGTAGSGAWRTGDVSRRVGRVAGLDAHPATRPTRLLAENPATRRKPGDSPKTRRLTSPVRQHLMADQNRMVMSNP